VIEGWGMDDAEIAIVAIGSSAGNARHVARDMRAKGVKAGVLKIRIFRPFPADEIRSALSGLNAVAVLDRAESLGAEGGPLYLEIKAALYDLDTRVPIVNYIYGLGGSDVRLELMERVFSDLSDIATYWCNDMLVDPEGRAYVGHFGFDLDAFLAEHGEAGVLAEPGPPRAHVILVHPSGAFEVAADDMRFPNGTVLTPDGRTLIVAETLALRLTAFDVADDGRLSNRRVWADLSAELVAPDGICLDAEGAVWVANAVGSTCLRVLEGGGIADRALFQQNVFACTLGGPDGTTLFGCTAPDSNADHRTGERQARIEVATVAVPGAGPIEAAAATQDNFNDMKKWFATLMADSFA